MTLPSQPLCPKAFNTVKVIPQALCSFQQLQTRIVRIVTDCVGFIASILLQLPFSVGAWITSNNQGRRAIGPLNYSAYCQGYGKRTVPKDTEFQRSVARAPKAAQTLR